jgi:hypothetical protein
VLQRLTAVFAPRDFLRDPFVRVCLAYLGGVTIPLRYRGCVFTAGGNNSLLYIELCFSPPLGQFPDASGLVLPSVSTLPSFPFPSHHLYPMGWSGDQHSLLPWAQGVGVRVVCCTLVSG